MPLFSPRLARCAFELSQTSPNLSREAVPDRVLRPSSSLESTWRAAGFSVLVVALAACGYASPVTKKVIEELAPSAQVPSAPVPSVSSQMAPTSGASSSSSTGSH